MMSNEILIDGVNVAECFCPFDEDLAREIFKKLDDRIKRLKAENEDIKKRFEDLYQFNKRLIDEKYKLGVAETKLMKIRDKYKQALEEISDKLSELYLIPLQLKDCIDCDNSNREILNKINEVLK